MFKFQMQYRQELKAEITNIKAADLNIREAMTAWRNDTIKEIKEFLDDENTWEYPYEHKPGATGRSSGSQVRNEHGSEHFAFRKFGQPAGRLTTWQVNIENASPDNVGNFILGGAGQPSRPIMPLDPDNYLRWRHERQGSEGIAKMIPASSRYNIPGRFQEFQQEISNIAFINMKGTEAYLTALGDDIFNMFSVRSIASRDGSDATLTEPEFYIEGD